ncbi:MAG: hypothetical protein M5R36_18135 [Deltaproteobacteria bacterium]|nr:hypothetical protein [Deltaproteobacteria bacterium]
MAVPGNEVPESSAQYRDGAGKSTGNGFRLIAIALDPTQISPAWLDSFLTHPRAGVRIETLLVSFKI